MNDIPGKIIGIIIAFFGCVVMPLTNNAVATELTRRRQILTETFNLLDEVIDSKEYNSNMQESYTHALAQYGAYVDFEVIKEKRDISSTSSTGGATSGAALSYIKVTNPDEEDGHADGVIHYATGDRVGVHITNLTYSSSQGMIRNLVGYSLPKFEYTLYARVR